MEARIKLDKGIIKELAFGGDYMFDTPPAALSERLQGTRYDKNSVSEALESSPVASFFPGSSAAELLELLFGA